MGDEQGETVKPLNLLPEKVLEKVYDDAASKPAVQIGKFSEDSLKALRLFTAPLQLLGAFQDRLERWLDKVRSGVPPEEQTESPPEIAGPVIERLRYIDEDNPLHELYLNLLARSVDRRRQSEAHPSFVRVIEQLSPDEARILSAIVRYPDRTFEYREEGLVVIGPIGGVLELVGFQRWTLILQKGQLAFPQRGEMYLSHMDSLGLFRYSFFLEEGLSLSNLRELRVTSFGKLFLTACVPPSFAQS